MIHKTATAKVRELTGEPYLTIHKGCYGYYCTDSRYRRQHGTLVQRTVQDVIKDVMSGSRPREMQEVTTK